MCSEREGRDGAVRGSGKAGGPVRKPKVVVASTRCMNVVGCSIAGAHVSRVLVSTHSLVLGGRSKETTTTTKYYFCMVARANASVVAADGVSITRALFLFDAHVGFVHDRLPQPRVSCV